MTDSLRKEIKNLIDVYQLNCLVDNFYKSLSWYQWDHISQCQILTESFIEKFKDNVNWYLISEHQNLSEDFIEKFKDKVDWYNISIYQKLTEPFIEKFNDKVDWPNISIYQKLSEPFIKKFKNYVSWIDISKYQKLSEPFIEKFEDYVNWFYISKYQKLSEPFIEKIKNDVNWYYISKYQKLSKSFIEKYNLNIPPDNTNYMTKREIKNLIPSCYQRDGDYIIAYKNIRRDRYSHYNFQYKYEKGGIYESHCDCNNDNENSFGLSLWTEKEAKGFRRNGIVIKCRVKVEDIGAIVHRGNKLRCKRIEVLN